MYKRQNTTSSYNTAVGAQALEANTTGGNNTAVGYQALHAVTTNSHNTAIGHQALLNNDAQYNTACGKEAIKSNTSGARLVGVGNRALFTNTTGDYNHAFGDHALFYNTEGEYNVAVGYQALMSNTTASYNTAVGHNSAISITTGHSSVAVGYQALDSATTGFRNIAIGYEAGASITDGGDNICIGYHAGVHNVALTTGDDNVYIGDFTYGSDPNEVKATVLGYNGVGKGSQTFFIKADSGVYNSGNNSSWSTTSDIRIKKNIVDCTTGLDKINQLRVRNFEYRTEEEITDFKNPSAVKVDKQGLQVGVIAQEIAEVLPDTVEQMTTGAYTVNPDNLTWYLVNAIKELSSENDALKARLDAAGI